MCDNELIAKLKHDGFSLVLSGGAALGCAHLGVLEYLEDHALFPSEIVGTSMGAIVGAACAHGFSSGRIAGFFEKFARVTRWMEFSWSMPSFLKAKKISAIFEDLFGDATLAQVKTPLKIVATNFENGETRVFSRDDQVLLRDAVLGSMSIPVLFPPVAIEQNVYVDGGLSANLPVAYVSDANKPTVAVDVMSGHSLEPLSQHDSFLGKAKTLFAWSERTFYLMIQNQTKEALKGTVNVNCLKPRLAGYKVYHFDKWNDLREEGRKEAQRFFGKTT